MVVQSRRFSPAERDRWMQVFLAQARGPLRNAELLCQAIDLMLHIQARRQHAPGGRIIDNALVDMLGYAAGALDDLAVPYAVTGSIASAVYSEPVMSQDVDLVVRATPEDAVRIGARLQPRFYAPRDMLSAAAAQCSFANVVDNSTGLKVDLSFVPASGFLAAALARRVRQRLGPHAPEFWFVTPEDVILMKLVWRKGTQSSKQWQNALSVARINGARMDWKYLFETARGLSVEDDLVRLRDEAGI